MGWLERDVRVRVCGHVNADVAAERRKKETRASDYAHTWKKGKTRKTVSRDVGGTFTRGVETKQNHVHAAFIRFYDRWRMDLVLQKIRSPRDPRFSLVRE